MGFSKEETEPGFGNLFCLFICLPLFLTSVDGKIVLLGRNFSESFLYVEANFARTINDSGEVGILFLAEPLNACTPLTNEVVNGSKSSFVLIIRGGCAFDQKVRNAQGAGFAAAVVYNDEDSGVLVAMAGNPKGIMIPAVFVSGFSGEVLKKYAGNTDIMLWMIPSPDDYEWSITTLYLTLVLLVAIIVVLGFLACQRYVRPAQARPNQSPGISSREVKGMPSLRFSTKIENRCISSSCAICLEDYKEGENLRLLPCHHDFHASCVDTWLMMWRSFCPLCKQDVRIHTGNHPADESTPLLSPTHSSPTLTNQTDPLLLPQTTPSSLARLLPDTADNIDSSPFYYDNILPLNSRSSFFRNYANPHSHALPFPFCSRQYSSSAAAASSNNASTSSSANSSTAAVSANANRISATEKLHIYFNF